MCALRCSSVLSISNWACLLSAHYFRLNAFLPSFHLKVILLPDLWNVLRLTNNRRCLLRNQQADFQRTWVAPSLGTILMLQLNLFTGLKGQALLLWILPGRDCIHLLSLLCRKLLYLSARHTRLKGVASSIILFLYFPAFISTNMRANFLRFWIPSPCGNFINKILILWTQFTCKG